MQLTAPRKEDKEFGLHPGEMNDPESRPGRKAAYEGPVSGFEPKTAATRACDSFSELHFAWMLGLLTFCQRMGFPLDH